jgi:hypothetical protein
MNFWPTMFGLPTKSSNLFRMSKSKKIFVAFAAIFFIALAYVSFDISRRTTFPGSKSQLKERLQEKYLRSDTTRTDSMSRKKGQKK